MAGLRILVANAIAGLGGDGLVRETPIDVSVLITSANPPAAETIASTRNPFQLLAHQAGLTI